MNVPLKHKYCNAKDQSSTLWARTFYWSSRRECLQTAFWKLALSQLLWQPILWCLCVTILNRCSLPEQLIHLSANWKRWSDYSLLNWQLKVGADVTRLSLCKLQTCGHNNTMLRSITGKQTCSQTRGQTNLKQNQSASRHEFPLPPSPPVHDLVHIGFSWFLIAANRLPASTRAAGFLQQQLKQFLICILVKKEWTF